MLVAATTSDGTLQGDAISCGALTPTTNSLDNLYHDTHEDSLVPGLRYKLTIVAVFDP
jgi:hypothetical protein